MRPPCPSTMRLQIASPTRFPHTLRCVKALEGCEDCAAYLDRIQRRCRVRYDPFRIRLFGADVHFRGAARLGLSAFPIRFWNNRTIWLRSAGKWAWDRETHSPPLSTIACARCVSAASRSSSSATEEARCSSVVLRAYVSRPPLVNSSGLDAWR